MALQNHVNFSEHAQSEERLVRKWTNFLTVSSISCGLSATASLIVNILTLTNVARHSVVMNYAGLLLTIAFFSTAGFSAHCLDKLADAEKTARHQKLRAQDVFDRDWR